MRVKCPECGHEHDVELKSNPSKPRFYSLEEIAGTILPVTRDTLKRWIRLGHIEATKLGTGKGASGWCIEADYLERWIQQRKGATKRPAEVDDGTRVVVPHGNKFTTRDL